MKLIYWLRNDLRIRDNAALDWISRNATSSCEVAFVYVAPPGLGRAGKAKRQFVEESLSELAFSLKNRFSIYKISGTEDNPPLLWLLENVKPDTIVYTAEHTSDEVKEESELASWAAQSGVQIQAFDQATILPSRDLPFPIDQLPKVFTAFRQKTEPLILAKEFSIDERDEIPCCLNFDLVNALNSSLDGSEIEVDIALAKSFARSESVEELPTRGFRFHGGFRNGQSRIAEYLWETDAVQGYFESRNGMIEKNDSTKFSPWLAVGAISPREIINELRRYETERIKNKSTYWVVFELLWRDFFKFEARRVGNALFLLNGPNGKKPQVCDPGTSEVEFEKWATGKTASEFINANIREIVETGWMSNRGRQNVASYLAKTLEVPWTLGADFFERHLVDSDAAVNWGNWNYFSGVGRDPRDRRFNTTTQENSYDPDGRYRTIWRAD
jgi:deoxyribodipyrimidine photo-lyase